jgi:cobalt-zinc-cadmium efflux system outer membrane protein
MLSRRWAAALASCCVLAAHSALAEEFYSLDDALERVVASHPGLVRFRHEVEARSAAVEQAALRPALSLRADMENFAGTGDLSGLDGVEVTLGLASVLERGGKPDARRALAARELDAVESMRRSAELDLLAETARRYLEVVSAQERRAIAADEVDQRRRAAAAARRRVEAGASPLPVQLGAEAMLARAELDAARASAEGEAAWRRLAVLWGATEPGPVRRVSRAVLELPSLPPLADLLRRVERSPELRQFADEARIAEARLQLAEASRATDIEWQVGARYLQGGDDWALVAGVAVPIGASRRAEPSVRAARATAARLEVERESTALALLATLVAAHGQFTAAAIDVTRISDEWLPRLATAEAAAGQAFRAGALSYLEWAQLQAETTAARRQQLAAALEAHRALVEIQRLTGEPIVAPTTASREIP